MKPAQLVVVSLVMAPANRQFSKVTPEELIPTKPPCVPSPVMVGSMSTKEQQLRMVAPDVLPAIPPEYFSVQAMVPFTIRFSTVPESTSKGEA